MITLVRSGRDNPPEIGLLVACLGGGVAGLSLGPFVPSTTSHIGPPWIFYGLVLLGGVLGLGGIAMAVVFRTRHPQAALVGISLERAGVLLVGAEWLAYALALVDTAGVRGIPVAAMLAGIGGVSGVGRAWQITNDLRKARKIAVARRSDGDRGL